MKATLKRLFPDDDGLNEKHASNPQPGDYWSEHFCPYLLVLARVSPTHIIVYQTRKDAGPNHWTWDTTKPEMLSLEQLRKRVTYGTIPGFMADVSPKCQMEFVRDWQRASPGNEGSDK